MTMTDPTTNGHHPAKPANKGGRPPKTPDLPLDEAQALYDAACEAVTKAERAERTAGAELAAATAAYDLKKAQHTAKADELTAAEAAKVTARDALRKAQGRTS